MTEPATDGMSALDIGEPAASEIAPDLRRRFATRGLSLRGFAARGMMINTAFDVGLQLLSLSRGFLIAAFLSRADYGVWGVLGVSLGVLARLKVVGVGDRYMQQNDPDQELAYQQAFTMEVLVTGVALVPLFLALPIVALAYGHWSVVGPGAVLLLSLPAGPFCAPLWVYYREMEFGRARLLQSLDPVVGFIVAIGLAIAGAGYWSLVAGVLAGQWACAIGCSLKAHYPYRWRYEKGVMRLYRSYSMPLLVTSLVSIVLANSASLATNAKLGLAGVGVVALAASITSFSTNVDDIVSGTLYPAICATQDRLDLLRESFEKVNRLALVWAMPFGIGLALFCGDLIRFGLGHKWAPAVQLLQITGVVVAIGHIGFNWDDYFRARANTKPIGTTAVASGVSFVAVGVPLTLAFGLRGLGAGIAFQSLVAMVFRAYYLNRMFEDFVFIRHALRSIVMTAPAAGLVLLLRALESGDGSFGLAVTEVAMFVAVTGLSTWLFEGKLLREAIGYALERRKAPAA